MGSGQSHMRGVGIDMRNLANRLLLLNAAAVKASGGDPDHLFYLDGVENIARRAADLPAHIALQALAEGKRATAEIAKSPAPYGLIAAGLGLVTVAALAFKRHA